LRGEGCLGVRGAGGMETGVEQVLDGPIGLEVLLGDRGNIRDGDATVPSSIGQNLHRGARTALAQAVTTTGKDLGKIQGLKCF